MFKNLILTFILCLQGQQNPCMQGTTAPPVLPVCFGLLDYDCMMRCISDYSRDIKASRQQYCTETQNAWNTYDQAATNCQNDYDACLGHGTSQTLCTLLLNSCLAEATDNLAQSIDDALDARSIRDAAITAAFYTCFLTCCEEK